MKTMTKKLGAVVLALAMCFSLCCTALAADEGTYTITVNGYTGQNYIAYKVFDATYSGSKEEKDLIVSYTIDSSSLWYPQVADATDVFKLTQINGTTTYVVEVADDTVTGEQIAAALQPVPEGAEIAAMELVERTGETSEATTFVMNVSKSGAGYYFVTTTLGSAVAVNSATPNVTVNDKNTPPKVTKDVDTVKEESEENNVTVEYEFKIDNVHGIHNLALEDAMEVSSEKVTYGFDWESLTVTLVDNGVETPITDTEYTLVIGPDDGCDFHVLFKVWDETAKDWIEYDFDNVSDDAYVYVTIDCTVNAEGAEFEDDEYELPNHAAVTYGNDGHSVWDDAEVYEFGFKVFKYTGEEQTALPGVTFELKNSADEGAASAWFEVETINDQTIYLFEGWTQPEAKEGVTYTQTLTTDSEGMLYIEGLDATTYYLYETSTLDGYNPLTGPVTVTIVAVYDETTGKVSHTVSYTYGTTTVEDAENHQVDVENNAGSELPSTGGIGTTIFYIIGGVLVVGAVVVLVTRRRMTREG